MRDFEDKIAVVTGGASGIGRAIATQLAEAGAHVVIADIDGDAVADACKAFGARGLTVDGKQVDVTKPESVAALAEFVFANHDNVHLLFNNAGVGIKEAKRRLWTLPEKDWQWAFAVNVMGVVNGIRAFVPTMLENGQPGHIVNTSSGNGGLVPMPTTPVYASSKAAVTSLTEVLHYQFLLDGAKLKAHVLFPGPHLVNTSILNSDRVRPESFKVDGAAPNVYVDMEALAKSAGVEFKLTEPEDVAAMAIQGVVEGKFWILSRESNSYLSLPDRTQSILDQRNPELG